MKWKNPLLAGCVVLFLATGTAHATADGCSVVLRTPDGFLNLRTLPKMGTRIIARLKPGSIIYNDEKTENGWTHVTGIPWGNSRIRPVIGWTKSRFIVTVNCENLETAHVDWSPEYPQTQGAWHCVIPGTATRHDETVDIELRKYAVHDNAYVIRGEFPVWGNGEGLSLKYTDDMEVIFFNGVPCQAIKDGN